jgi:hypothetical protein
VSTEADDILSDTSTYLCYLRETDWLREQTKPDFLRHRLAQIP